MITLHSITDTEIRFDATFRNGVPTVPKRMRDLAAKIAAKYGRVIVGEGGDDKYVCFEVAPEFTEEEAAKAEEEFL